MYTTWLSVTDREEFVETTGTILPGVFHMPQAGATGSLDTLLHNLLILHALMCIPRVLPS